MDSEEVMIMTDSLIKIKNYRGESIEEYSIYLNLDKGQYVHRFKCDSCGKDVGCYCYDELESAVKDIHDLTMNCDDCFISSYIYENYIEDDAMFEIIDKNEGTDFMGILKLIRSIEDHDFDSGIGDLFWEELEHITCNMGEKTKKELMHLAIDSCDFDGIMGSLCST